jgi:hypothetical protein
MKDFEICGSADVQHWCDIMMAVGDKHQTDFVSNLSDNDSLVSAESTTLAKFRTQQKEEELFSGSARSGGYLSAEGVAAP